MLSNVIRPECLFANITITNGCNPCNLDIHVPKKTFPNNIFNTYLNNEKIRKKKTEKLLKLNLPKSKKLN